MTDDPKPKNPLDQLQRQIRSLRSAAGIDLFEKVVGPAGMEFRRTIDAQAAVQGIVPKDLMRANDTQAIVEAIAATHPSFALDNMMETLGGSALGDLHRLTDSVSAAFGDALYLGEIADVDPDALLDDSTLDELRLEGETREAIIRADRLPLAVLQQLMQAPDGLHELGSRDFEAFIADLLERLGYRDVTLTPASRDGGRDVCARLIAHGIPLAFIFECKHYRPDRKIGVEIMRALLGVALGERSVNKAVLVTTSTFTAGSRDIIAKHAILDGKDYDGIVEWIRAAKT